MEPSPRELDDEVTALFDREAGRLVAYLVGVDRGLGWQDAEDLAQEAFLVTRMSWSRVRCYESPVAFVVATANVLRKNHHRRARRHVTDPLIEAAHLALIDGTDREAALDLRDALNGLPERQRQVLLLRDLLGFSVRDTATALNVSEGTIKSTRSDGVRHLRRILNGAEE
jgi:RNA polymerase sigma factor (sigma-70 family)